jgi:drug/metabolite transporter (DMT)-like permease
MNRRAWILLLLLASLWGASYLFIKVGLRDLTPAEIAMIRTALGALVLTPVVIRRRAIAAVARRWPYVALLAVVQVAGPFLLINAGEQHISSSLTGILVSTTPLFTALFALRVDHTERTHGAGLAGLALGLVGVALIVGLDLSGDSAAVFGGLMVLGGAAGYAIGGLLVKRDGGDLDPLGIAWATLVVSTVICGVPAAATLSPELPGALPLLATAALGVLGTGAAFAIYFTLIAEVGAARAALSTYIVPAFALVYGVLLLDEVVTVASATGLVLVVGGSWLAAGGVRDAPGAPSKGADSRVGARLAEESGPA